VPIGNRFPLYPVPSTSRGPTGFNELDEPDVGGVPRAAGVRTWYPRTRGLCARLGRLDSSEQLHPPRACSLRGNRFPGTFTA
jgi:hypothetical protein